MKFYFSFIFFILLHSVLAQEGLGAGGYGPYGSPGYYGNSEDPFLPDDAPEDYYNSLAILQTLEGYPELTYSDIGATSEKKGRPQLIRRYDDGVRGILKLLPESALKSGLNKYLEIIKAKAYNEGDRAVGIMNSGLVAYNIKTMRENPCFSKLAEAFYKDIKMQDEALDQTNKSVSARANLLSTSGKGQFSELRPGWLFKKALKYSGGDPNIAFNLLSLCGHDDTAQGDLNYRLTNKTSVSKELREDLTRTIDYQISLKKEILNEARISYELFMKESAPVTVKESNLYNSDSNRISTIKSLETYLKKLQAFRDQLFLGKLKIKTTNKRLVHCPQQNSSFYLSKALSKETDLSESFKDRIARIQAPTKGRGALPAKNYHFIASAFMACNLVSQGVSPRMAKTIQTIAGWAYRSVRMNDLLSRDLRAIKKTEDLYKSFTDNFRRENSYKVKTSRGTRTKYKRPPSFEKWMVDHYDLSKIPMKDFVVLKHATPDNFTDIEMVKKWRIKYDAAKVLDDMTIGGEIFGVKLPHTNFTLSFFDDPVSTHIKLDTRDQKKVRTSRKRSRYNPLGWPPERYKKAKEKALTYLVDWEWTTKQHQIGSDFSSKICEKKPKSFKPDDKSCRTFANRPGESCDIDYTVGQVPDDSLIGGMYSGFGGNVDQLTTSMEQISDQMTYDYLDSEIKFNEDKNELNIDGLY